MTMANKCKSLLMVLCLACLTGCDRSDDLESIFTGKVWHLAGFYQTTDWDNPNMSRPMNSDYNSHSDLSAYNITFFTDGTAHVTLPQGVQLTALWTADGNERRRTFSFSEWKTIQGDPTTLIGPAKQMYDRLHKTAYYQGNAQYIQLFDDSKRYFIQFADLSKYK